jgi:hypothetical protein
MYAAWLPTIVTVATVEPPSWNTTVPVTAPPYWLATVFDLAASGAQEGSDKDAAKTKTWLGSRDEAASHLTPSDLSRVQERARKWFENHPAKPQ